MTNALALRHVQPAASGAAKLTALPAGMIC